MSDNSAKHSVFPTGDEHLDKLHKIGDPLERLICEDLESLQNVLLPYARVWAGHIEPRRKDEGALLQAEWQKFGGRHYTALIRLHHAYAAKNQILELCNEEIRDDNYERLLEVHSACTSLWDNLGAAIDNFVRAREEARRVLGIGVGKRKTNSKCGTCGANESEENFEARALSPEANPKLYYAFQRRHQFIHSIIVPQKIEGGMIVFNLTHFKQIATDWTEEEMRYECIDSKMQRDWDEILLEFGNEWAALSSWLAEKDEPRPANASSAGSANSAPIELNDYSSLIGKSTTSNPLSGSRTTPPSGTYNG